jgi:hypothetical protein
MPTDPLSSDLGFDFGNLGTGKFELSPKFDLRCLGSSVN